MTIFITTISVLALLAFGFLGGIVFAAWGMAKKAMKSESRIREANSKDKRARRIIPKYQHAFLVAASCWCDPRTCNTMMDPVLGTVFAEKIAVYIEALQWCGGSADFGPEGKAWIGFEKVCRPLMQIDYKIDVGKLTPSQYQSLREYTPELLGLKGKNG